MDWITAKSLEKSPPRMGIGIGGRPLVANEICSTFSSNTCSTRHLYDALLPYLRKQLYCRGTFCTVIAILLRLQLALQAIFHVYKRATTSN